MYCYLEVTLELIFHCHNFKSQHEALAESGGGGGHAGKLSVEVKFPFVFTGYVHLNSF